MTLLLFSLNKLVLKSWRFSLIIRIPLKSNLISGFDNFEIVASSFVCGSKDYSMTGSHILVWCPEPKSGIAPDKDTIRNICSTKHISFINFVNKIKRIKYKINNILDLDTWILLLHWI